MKRYDVIGEPTFDFVHSISGDVIFYSDYIDFISARIKKLEDLKFNTLTKHGQHDFNVTSAVINELKNLLR